MDGHRAHGRRRDVPRLGRADRGVRGRDWHANFFPTGIAHSILGGTAWEPTPWRTVQRPAWLVVGAGRRVRLEDVVSGTESIFPVRRLAPDGLVAWKQMVERGYEDYVAKDEASPTRAGDEALAQGQAEGPDRRRGPLAAAEQLLSLELLVVAVRHC